MSGIKCFRFITTVLTVEQKIEVVQEGEDQNAINIIGERSISGDIVKRGTTPTNKIISN